MTNVHAPRREAEARLLILIDAFTTPSRNLQGRTKLAKLDFFLRYPKYLRRALEIRAPNETFDLDTGQPNIENRMVRFRYGPWDPSYFVLLGRLFGKGLIAPVADGRGIGYRSTDLGRRVAGELAANEGWQDDAERARLLRRYLDLTGTNLKNFVYEHFPEVTQKRFGEEI